DRDANFEVLQELITNNQIIAPLKDRFDFDKGFFRDDFISLLYAMGFVTMVGQKITYTIFAIPNYVIKHLYFNYFQVELERKNSLKFNDMSLKDAIFDLALKGDVKPFETELREVLQVLSNRDLLNYHEKHFQTLVLTLLNITDFYFIQSEGEYNKKYIDIMLLERNPFEVDFQYLFELKWAKKKDNDYEDKKKEGIVQIKGYLQLPAIKSLKNLQSYLIISNGEKLEIVEVLN
ncbi:MAG: PD-(D/E)XK nuclease domain-containing protein, partial [Sulfurimonas sp.]|nr:PD-(D/E)XK nuclease domain-containing protein [Sulfurimonas sp.]